MNHALRRNGLSVAQCLGLAQQHLVASACEQIQHPQACDAPTDNCDVTEVGLRLGIRAWVWGHSDALGVVE